jgi:deoxyribodipyrimidine photolyase-related protein
MKENLLIFPNNLFEVEYLPKKNKINKVYLIEEPIFFGNRKIKLNLNKLKMVLHRASMKYYYDYLDENGYKPKYIEYKELNKSGYNKFFSNEEKYYYFQLNDHLLQKKINNYFKNIEELTNPNFLLAKKQLDKYHNEKDSKNKFFHKNFYNFVKKELKILENEKSYDEENRNSIPEDIKIPKLPKKTKSKYENEAIKYIEEIFPKNPGNSDNLIFPITHKDSKKWLKYFLRKKFSKYGDYQDSISKDNWFLFHSTLSPMINCGLINPKSIVKEVNKYYENNDIDINNYEGFIRQIIGWREYQRYCYLYEYDKMVNKNFFGNENKLTKKWYNGETGIKPVDDCIKIAFKYGYLHHILRLMVMANFMNLCRIKPIEAYKWFMEFSVDSYDWVMIQNVYSMGMWSDGGLTMKKPYITTDNYILKMSNYDEEKWCEKWRSLFYVFLKDNKKKISNTFYARNLGYWNNLEKKEQSKMNDIANKLINNITK